MATLSPIIYKAKVLKGGRHKIRIAVRHKHVTAYILTNIIIDSETQFKNGQIVKRPDAATLNKKIRVLMDLYQTKLDEIDHPELYSCTQLKQIIIESSMGKSSTTFVDVTNEYVAKLIKEGRTGYAKMLMHNCENFTCFTKGNFPMSGITPQLIESYAEYLKNKKKLSKASVNAMMARTKVIVNYALKSRWVKYEFHPFCSYKITASPIREADISVSSMNKIINFKTTEKREIVARDLFCLSFFLGGINLIDLLNIDFRNDEIQYIRTKSKNTTTGTNIIRLSVPIQAKEIINKWMDKRGKLSFGYNFTNANFTQYVTRTIKKIAIKLGIQEKVIFYSARKTFAQFASDLGIPDTIIDYCLGHSMYSKGIIRYYTKVRHQQADMAIRKVIDYVEHPEYYTDYIELRKNIMMSMI